MNVSCAAWKYRSKCERVKYVHNIKLLYAPKLSNYILLEYLKNFEERYIYFFSMMKR